MHRLALISIRVSLETLVFLAGKRQKCLKTCSLAFRLILSLSLELQPAIQWRQCNALFVFLSSFQNHVEISLYALHIEFLRLISFSNLLFIACSQKSSILSLFYRTLYFFQIICYNLSNFLAFSLLKYHNRLLFRHAKCIYARQRFSPSD